jgi:hypothetical protein
MVKWNPIKARGQKFKRDIEDLDLSLKCKGNCRKQQNK